MRLGEKVALVTGAGSGIGRATARLFAGEGARVVAVDYDSEAGQQTAAEINEHGGEATFVRADVSRAGDAEAMVRAAVDAYGRLDIIHNNAGIFPTEGPAHEMAEDLWDRIIDINLKGVWLGCKFAIPELIRSGGGAIVNTASMAGVRGRAYRSAYCASKGGVIMLTKALAMELAPHNIRVNCICPAGVNTPLVRPADISEEEMAERFVEGSPIPRMARPEEIAEAALYLATDASSYVTGQALMIDGGQWAGTMAGVRR
jgi:NAD(P)-dependent dehydrogenase (short-subunit alcohol dehydrogenase family)